MARKARPVALGSVISSRKLRCRGHEEKSQKEEGHKTDEVV